MQTFADLQKFAFFCKFEQVFAAFVLFYLNVQIN